MEAERHCRSPRRLRSCRVAVALGSPNWWARRPEPDCPFVWPAQALTGATRRPPRPSPGRRRGVWLLRRRLDLFPSRDTHPKGVRRLVPQGPRLAPAQELGVDTAETDSSGIATRRRRHRGVARGRLARDQKKALKDG